jgi:hypothetical protein
MSDLKILKCPRCIGNGHYVKDAGETTQDLEFPCEYCRGTGSNYSILFAASKDDLITYCIRHTETKTGMQEYVKELESKLKKSQGTLDRLERNLYQMTLGELSNMKRKKCMEIFSKILKET